MVSFYFSVFLFFFFFFFFISLQTAMFRYSWKNVVRWILFVMCIYIWRMLSFMHQNIQEQETDYKMMTSCVQQFFFIFNNSNNNSITSIIAASTRKTLLIQKHIQDVLTHIFYVYFLEKTSIFHFLVLLYFFSIMPEVKTQM